MANIQKTSGRITTTNLDPLGLLSFPPDLAKLKSALSTLPNSIDARTLALYRISPIAREARLFPDMATELQDLTRNWFLGSLEGAATTPSTTKGPNGISGAEYFDALWQYFLNNRDFKGTPTTLGSLYFHAKQRGWAHESADAMDFSDDEALL